MTYSWEKFPEKTRGCIPTRISSRMLQGIIHAIFYLGICVILVGGTMHVKTSDLMGAAFLLPWSASMILLPFTRRFEGIVSFFAMFMKPTNMFHPTTRRYVSRLILGWMFLGDGIALFLGALFLLWRILMSQGEFFLRSTL